MAGRMLQFYRKEARRASELAPVMELTSWRATPDSEAALGCPGGSS